MPISSPFMLNSGPPELPGLIEVSIWMQSVYSSNAARGRLIAVHAADQAEGTVGVKSVASRERVAHGERPVAGPHLVAVAHGGEGELFAFLLGQELDQRHVADLVDADQDGVVQHAVGEAALHERPGRLHDVEVGQGVAVLGR